MKQDTTVFNRSSVADPMLFLTLGSGIRIWNPVWKKSGSGINISGHISESLAIQIFWVKNN
jgi:hypothetical protein